MMAPTSPAAATPPTEVPDKATRRSFTADYKRRILREADACKEKGAVAALLRREGLYYSRLTEWRQARERGELGTTRARGPTPKPPPDARDRRIAELERENARLDRRARRSEAMVELQKKVALFLEAMAGDDSGAST